MKARRRVILAVLVAASVIAPAAQQPVPIEYQDLHAELSTSLSDFRLLIDQSWDGTKAPVTFSAHLLTANSSRGPLLVDPGYGDSVTYELDGLKALGVKAVSLDVSFPMLYAPFFASQAEYQQYLDFYTRVAAGVRARGLKLIVETQALFSQGGYTYWDVRPFYASLTLEQYRQGRMEVARTIAQNLRPDYLAVIEEPDTEAEQTGKPELGTAAGSAALLDVILGGLEAAGVQGVAIGAGLGTWQTDYLSFVNNFASRPIDFLDMHVYPVNRDYLQRTLAIADLAASYGKQVTMSETWLFKARDRELDILGFPSVFSRDVFEFWEPLDSLHLQTMVKLAHFKHFTFMAPFWSSYFRGYIAYDDTTNGLPPQALTLLAVQEQLANTAGGTYTATGFAYKDAILDAPDLNPPSTPQNVKAQAVSATGVTLTWSPATDNVGTIAYSVSRNGVRLGQTGLNSFTDLGLADGREYVYGVSAIDASSNESQPASVSITTRDQTPPRVPAGLTALVTGSSSQIDIELSWTPSTDNVGIVNYRVYRGTSPANLSQIGAPTTPSFTILNVARNTTYYFTVSARDAAWNDSGQSEAVVVTTSGGSDVTPPVVEVTSPTEGTKVAGTTYLYARVYDPSGGGLEPTSGPAGVQFKLDGVNIGLEETVPYSTSGQSSTYRGTWEIKNLKKGQYAITALARDRAGNMTTSAVVNVIVKSN